MNLSRKHREYGVENEWTVPGEWLNWNGQQEDEEDPEVFRLRYWAMQ